MLTSCLYILILLNNFKDCEAYLIGLGSNSVKKSMNVFLKKNLETAIKPVLEVVILNVIFDKNVISK